MSRRTLTQISFTDPEFVCPFALTVGTAAWLLARYRAKVLPAWLFVGWRGEGRFGRAAWPAQVLATLLLLRWTREGMSRRGACDQAIKNVEWRAALGLQMDAPTPDEKTVREFERFMRERHPTLGARRYELLHEHIVRLCLETKVVGDAPVWVTDSTPMLSYGASLDTVRLLGDGLRKLGLNWARLSQCTVATVADQWGLPLLVAKSTKGALSINWSDEGARTAVIAELAESVVRVVDMVRRDIGTVRANKRKGLLRQCRALLKVVRDDLEVDEKGNLVVARKVTGGRLVSITDPLARNGRKSKSHKFKGFKVHVLGDAVSGLVASLAVTPGNAHDGGPAPRVLRRANDLIGGITRVLADTAYGGATLRRTMAQTLGIKLVSPPPPTDGRKHESLSKNDFAIDFPHQTATCPNGQTTSSPKQVRYASDGRLRLRFTWTPEQCEGCPLSAQCQTTGTGGPHSILLHPDEEELRQARKDWEDPDVREEYRQRAKGERLVHIITRRGGRKARQWGLAKARQQIHAVAATANLLLLAKAFAKEDERTAAAA